MFSIKLLTSKRINFYLREEPLFQVLYKENVSKKETTNESNANYNEYNNLRSVINKTNEIQSKYFFTKILIKIFLSL